MSYSRERCDELTEKVAKLCRADDYMIALSGSRHGFTRFAVNTVTTSGDVEDVDLSVWSAFGKKSGSSSTNVLDPEGIERCVRRSEELARLSPENPEHVPTLPRQEYLPVKNHDEPTAAMGAPERAAAVAAALELASGGGLEAAGYLEHRESFVARRSRNGVDAYGKSTSAEWSSTYRTIEGDGSSRSTRESWRLQDLETEALARRARDRSLLSRNPSRLDPGATTVVLEPQALSELLSYCLFDLSARDADEGRSFFGKEGGGTRQGEKVFGENVTVVSDPVRLGGAPFDWSGLPTRPMTWIDKGVVKSLLYDRYWAMQKKVEPTPWPTSVEMSGGEGTTEDLVKETERGLLVTRFWYTNYVDPETMLVTGLTRDGTFLIEKGKIVRPVMNFRFLESVAAVLSGIEALGKPVRVSGFSGAALIPPARVRGFHMESVSEAV